MQENNDLEAKFSNAWENFKGSNWKSNIDVSDFIIHNYKEYTDDDSFLTGISKKTLKVWGKCKKLLAREAISGVLDVETFIISGIDSFEPGDN